MEPPFILIIEDDTTLCTLLEDILTEAGYRAWSGVGYPAIRQAIIDPPALILLDIHMEPLSGWEIRRQLLNYAPTAAIPVVLMTAQAHSRQWQHDLHCCAQLDKPFSLDELLTVVRTHAPLP